MPSADRPARYPSPPTAGFAHEFNNLLLSVLGNADLLCDRLPPASEERAAAEEILLAARRAAALVRHLDVPATDATPAARRRATERVDLAGLAREAGRRLQAAMPTGGALHVATPERALPVRGDRGQLQQALEALVTNAAAALPATGGEVRLHLRRAVLDAARLTGLVAASVEGGRAAQPGSYVCVEVTDTGGGISPAVRARMFAAFDGAGAGAGGVVGSLELAAAVAIAHAHGGLLELATQEGQGTTVRLWLPLDIGAPTAVPDEPAMAAGVAGGRAGCPRTVLVVDDEVGVRRILARLLASAGHRVVEAPDGEEALALIAADPSRFDLVLLDLAMPRLTGDATLVALRARYPALPVVAMSGGAAALARAESSGSGGAAAFLSKPFDRRTVERVVGEALGEGR